MIQPEADQLKLALRLATQLAEVLAKLEQSPNLTSESRAACNDWKRQLDRFGILRKPGGLNRKYDHWTIDAILERAREQSSGQI